MTLDPSQTSERPCDPQPSWLVCADCSSTVYEIWSADSRTLRIEVAHSDTCPAWPGPDREVAIELLPETRP